jgi:hypothetical protein
MLYHTTITFLTKSRILRAMFHSENFEIEVLDKNTMIIFLWNVNKMDVWQAAVLLESTGIQFGYGFGDYKLEARTSAEEMLEAWCCSDKYIKKENRSI